MEFFMKRSIRSALLLLVCVLCLQSCGVLGGISTEVQNNHLSYSPTVIEDVSPMSSSVIKGNPIGDVTGDGEVTNSDVLALFRYIYNPDLYPLDFMRADVNGDGQVTNADVLAIYRCIYNSELYPLASDDGCIHNFVKKSTVAATVSENGYTVYTCSICNESYNGDYVPAKGTSGLKYTVNDDGVTCTIIKGSTVTDKVLIIPEYIGGYKVTHIGYEAFKKNTYIETVYLPDTVTHIEHAAFSECSNLYELQFPAKLESIGTWAFNNTKLTTDFYVPKTLTYLGASSFVDVNGLTDVYYEGSIEDWAKISIGANNTSFVNATRHYDYGTLTNPENYIIEKAAKAPTVDAIKEDGYTTKIEINQHIIIKEGYETSGKGRATAWVTNSNYGLYIYAEIQDSTLYATDEDDGDMFNVYIDFINSHGKLGLTGGDYRTTEGKAGKLGRIRVKPDGSVSLSWGFANVEKFKSAFKTISGGYAVELYIPFPKANNEGRDIGLGFEVKDDVDGDGSRDSAYFSHPIGNTFYLYYDRMPNYTLRRNYVEPATKIEYTKVNIGLDGYKDAAYRTRVDISSPWSGNPTGSVGNGTAWLAQDNNGLYAYIDVIDHNVFNNTDGSVTDGDRVQIYLDYKNDHETSGLAGTDYRATYNKGGYLGYITVTPDNEMVSTYSFGNLAGVKTATRKTDSGYAVEVYIPFNSAISGDIGIGFEIHNDTDGKLDSKGKHNREAIFYDTSVGSGYWNTYDSLPDYSIEEAPILTSFCFSDVHNNFAMLEPTNNTGDYIIRGTVTLAIKELLETEGKVDVVILGGDYMSDYPSWDEESGFGKLPYKYFLGYKAKTIATFTQLSEGGKFIYIGGNHDYAQGEASGLGGNGKNGTYNATDFYSGDGMEKVMGKLSADDMFTKVGTNTGLTYILAYYYEVDGIGFVGLAPDPDMLWLKQADGLNAESLAWLDAKLDEVDPDGKKVIFVNCHYPIYGRGENQGNQYNTYNAELLTPVFLGHNNLFHLYGHWESWNTTYTSANLSHYDKNGNIIDGSRAAVQSNDVILAKDRGFNAVYMGHFRPMQRSYPDWFYDDAVYGYGGYSKKQTTPSSATPKIAQGMYIEVYEDRIVFTMKNFGIIPGFESGTELVPYTVYLYK